MIMTSKAKTFFEVILNQMGWYNIIIEVLLIIQNLEHRVNDLYGISTRKQI
jgi:hypothetical protein